jgi:hypothetical protein
MRVARIFLTVLGVGTAVLGVLYVIAPNLFTGGSGFGTLAPEALTDFRATYGGFQIGAGLFLLWAARDVSRYRSGLVLLCILFPAVAVSRALGLLVDGNPTPQMVGALAFEIVTSVVSLLVLAKLPSAQRQASEMES